MKTMKKFWMYFINFIVLFLLVSGLIHLGTMKTKVEEEKVIQCVSNNTSPVIEITECKDGKLKGTITNDTNILINVVYVKAEFYNEDNELLGSQYSEIKYFNVGEKAKFEMDFNYKDVSKVNVTSTESIK